jgi:hypothetical protein
MAARHARVGAILPHVGSGMNTLAQLEVRREMISDGAYIRRQDGSLALSAAGKRQLDEFLPTVPTLTKMFAVMCEHPDLTSNGFDTPTSADFRAASARLMRDVEAFRRVVEWLERCPRIQTPKQPSYWCKHQIERQLRMYVSEGVLLCACLHLRIPMRPYPNGRGALLAISARELQRD